MKLRASQTRPLPDIAPFGNDGVMRWPNGDIWIPEATPPQRSGLFGHPTHADWERHAVAAAAQVRALARLLPRDDHRPLYTAAIHLLDDQAAEAALWEHCDPAPRDEILAAAKRYIQFEGGQLVIDDATATAGRCPILAEGCDTEIAGYLTLSTAPSPVVDEHVVAASA